MTDRILSMAQHGRLEKLADEFPQGKVVGWADGHAGPIVKDGTRLIVVTELGRRVKPDKKTHEAFGC